MSRSTGDFLMFLYAVGSSLVDDVIRRLVATRAPRTFARGLDTLRDFGRSMPRMRYLATSAGRPIRPYDQRGRPPLVSRCGLNGRGTLSWPWIGSPANSSSVATARL